MIRTTLSVCALFGTLILACVWLGKANQPSAALRVPAASAAPSETSNRPQTTDKPSTDTVSAASDGKPTLDCVEILPVCGDDCGRERVVPPAYLTGAIPSPHRYMVQPAAYNGPDSIDETDNFFDVESLNLEAARLAERTKVDADSPPEEDNPAAESSETKPAAEPRTLDLSVEDSSDDERSNDSLSKSRVVPLEERLTEQSPLAESPADDPSLVAGSSANSADADDSSRTLDNLIEKLTAKQQPALTPELIALREKLRDCLSYYYYRPENVATRSPWGSMHYMLAYGVDSQLIAGDRQVNACGWLCYNGVCNGQNLFYLRDGEFQAKIGPGVQGHAGQFLSMLAQSKVPRTFPMKVEGEDFTVADLIEYEKLTCKPNTELTFKLIALVHYLKSDDKWVSQDGEDWDIPRLIKEELKQPIIGAACGGTHRLTGFSYAIRKREQRKEEFTGQWMRAQKFINDYHDYTFKLQNPDGSFSTEWFAGRGDFGPPGRRLETTGHICEWLAFSLPEDQLTDPRMVKSVDYLTNLLLDGRNEKWNIGPLGHGLHALAIYDERLFGGKPGERAQQLARTPRVRNIR